MNYFALASFPLVQSALSPPNCITISSSKRRQKEKKEKENQRGGEEMNQSREEKKGEMTKK